MSSTSQEVKEENKNEEISTKNSIKCKDILDLDFAVYGYYLYCGKTKEDYFDEYRYGLVHKEFTMDGTHLADFGEYDWDWCVSCIEHIELPIKNSQEIATNYDEIYRNCWNNKYFYHNKCDIYDHEINLKCLNIKQCVAVKNISMALHFCAEMNNNDDYGKLIYEYFNDNYKTLEKDYHHILIKHLNHQDMNQNEENFHIIHNILSKRIKCKINSKGGCNPIARNNRNRDQENDNISIQISKNNDTQSQYYIDYIDNIHIYFLHTYAMGFRFEKNAIINDEKQNNDDENNYDDCNLNDLKQLSMDNRLKTMREYINVKRDKLDILRTQDTTNKFITTIADEKQDNNADNNTNHNVDATPQYAFGERYFYWKWFRNHDDKQYCDSYIEPKHKNFKQELLNYFSPSQYNSISLKATKSFHKSSILKAMKARIHLTFDNIIKYYEIPCFAPLYISHLIALICYTDFTKASYEFSKSFRPISSNESNESVKKRNSAYYWWSRNLRELVECYGDVIADKGITFYHGVSMIYFGSFHANFCTPTSTTMQLAVAISFTGTNNDGLILELEESPQYGSALKYFNASLLSAFSNEDERIFIGGHCSFKFKTIQLIKNNQNMKLFIRAMSYFDQVCNDGIWGNAAKKIDYKIMNALIKYELHRKHGHNNNNNENDKNKSIPTFIYECFARFCNEQTNARFNIGTGLNETFAIFRPLLMHGWGNNDFGKGLIDIVKVTNLLPNVHTIYSRDGYSHISQKYIDQIIEDIKVINKSIKTNKTKLNKIAFARYFPGQEHLTWGSKTTSFDLKTSIFDSLGWKAEIIEEDGDSLLRIVHKF